MFLSGCGFLYNASVDDKDKSPWMIARDTLYSFVECVKANDTESISDMFCDATPVSAEEIDALFDNIDGAKRIYGQNFMPFYNIGGIVKNVKYQIKYSFDMKNKETNEIETFNKVINYSEDLISFNSNAKYSQTCEDFIFEFNDCSINGEKYNRYKLPKF